LDRSRQEISGGSRRSEGKCILNYFQEVKISLLKYLVTSRCQVVQEEMKKNAFFYYFQEEKTSLLKHLVRSRQEILGGSRRNEEKCIFITFEK
jgi:hypothetical protein